MRSSTSQADSAGSIPVTRSTREKCCSTSKSGTFSRASFTVATVQREYDGVRSCTDYKGDAPDAASRAWQLTPTDAAAPFDGLGVVRCAAAVTGPPTAWRDRKVHAVPGRLIEINLCAGSTRSTPHVSTALRARLALTAGHLGYQVSQNGSRLLKFDSGTEAGIDGVDALRGSRRDRADSSVQLNPRLRSWRSCNSRPVLRRSPTWPARRMTATCNACSTSR